MRLISLIGLFIFFLQCPANAQQSSLNRLDEQGRKQGEWRAFDERGNLKFTGQFRDGIPYGEFRYYYKNGDLKAVSVFSNEGRETFTRTYHKNGFLMAEGKYLDRKKDSVWKYYSEWDENLLLSIEIYENTLKEGVWLNYYPDGEVAQKITYKNDVRQGPWKQFFNNGKLKLEARYENDELEGRMVVYYPDGSVNISGTYHSGMKEGEWVYFTGDAEKIKVEEYANGHLMHAEVYIEEEVLPDTIPE